MSLLNYAAFCILEVYPPQKFFLAYIVFLDLQRHYITRKYFLRDYSKTVFETDIFLY